MSRQYLIGFWWALPFCVFFSAITGAILGVPVLRLRGDYLAIVTLGFGQITNALIKSSSFKPLLGGPQGIKPIPSPTIDLTSVNPDLTMEFSKPTSMYYLFLFGIVITAFIVHRLINSRTGRAWRALRADEVVAQAMGINLVRTKLLAFGVSSAFAGLGGAIFGAGAHSSAAASGRYAGRKAASYAMTASDSNIDPSRSKKKRLDFTPP